MLDDGGAGSALQLRGRVCEGNLASTCRSDGFVDVEPCTGSETCTVARLPDGSVLDAYCNAPPVAPAPGCYGG